MDSTLSAGLDQSVVRTFLAVRVELSDNYVINIIDGSGTVTFAVDGEQTTFTGSDATYGTLGTMSGIEDKIASDSPRLNFTVLPPSAAASASLAQPQHQGSSVRVWFGLVNDATGAPIGTPELMWVGRLDFAKIQMSANVQTVELETVSAFDRLFVASEGARLNTHWHQSIWPGETGLDYNIDAQAQLYWGVNAPKPANATSGSWSDNFRANGFN